ncbi:type IX secretion system PorP/SprF family membrane protein [Mesonia hippocampi]|uniref:Type IX secretion system PorP/SprF family membrane protein n=1 Tax=Mesonia hippocampi TaxID=1628250 RepID=A0A840ESA7_9FLAO|nr:type IX secretion system membrane protein PorP/SprF [Mesonia hippocampi]MBB4118256.1 type IX secretion system PorP/SprF family membrane protein [Mesonia hippocampi]
MKNIYFLLTLGFIISTGLNAQQDPHYTQYMYNMNVVNPAYAGSKENLAVGLLYRTQWTSINGAPKTGTFAIHSPVTDKVGLGLSAITDQIGPVDETNVYADFSYTLNLGGEHKLAFGIKAGATFHKVGLYSDIGSSYLPQPNDPAFSENISNTYINIGTGAFYYTNKYYVALSVPNLLKSKHLDITQNGQELEFGSETQHYFITAGYVFNLTENTKFKPSFLLKSAFEAPTSLDVSANFLFYDKLEIGGTYRLDDAVGGLINFAVTPSLRIGYAYDHIVSDLDVATSASHEFLLLFDVNFAKKVSISPRFF